MKRYIFFLSVIVLLFTTGCSTDVSESEKKSTDQSQEIERAPNSKLTLFARDIVRSNGVPFSISDPFHGHVTNRIPLYKTDIKLSLNEGGTIIGNRTRVQYAWSSQGVIVDSVVFSENITGKWIERERILNGKEKVYQLTIDNLGYQWYLPADGKMIYANSGDNWEAMINNETSKSYPVLKLEGK